MLRFVLRLVGALLVEEICERIRPVRWELKYAVLEHPSARDWFEGECMVGVSGTTPEGVDVSMSVYPGWYVEREGATMHFTSTDPRPLLEG